MPEDLAVAVIPGIEPIVELGRQLRRNARRFRRRAHQLRIQQPPAQPRCKIVGKLPAPRAILPLNRNDPFDRRMHRKYPREWSIQRTNTLGHKSASACWHQTP